MTTQLGFDQGQGGPETCGRHGPGSTSERLNPIFFKLLRRKARLANIFDSKEKLFREWKPEFTSIDFPVTTYRALQIGALGICPAGPPLSPALTRAQSHERGRGRGCFEKSNNCYSSVRESVRNKFTIQIFWILYS